MPTTIRRKQNHFTPPQPHRNNLAVSPARDYEEPELDLAKHEEECKLRRRKIVGEAKEIVGKKDKIINLSKRRKTKSHFGDRTVIERLSKMIEDLDRAIEAKQHDLDVEGTAQAPENHFKLGVLRASDSLIRRAKALLEDYGSDLVNDLDPTEDIKAAGGKDLETRDWMCDHKFDRESVCVKCNLHINDIDYEDDE
jgi:hypothetical protein